MNPARIILGPPGTGKTTTLLGIISSREYGRCLPVSFTKAAAVELRQRIGDAGLPTEDLLGFGGPSTLHGLCAASLRVGLLDGAGSPAPGVVADPADDAAHFPIPLPPPTFIPHVKGVTKKAILHRLRCEDTQEAATALATLEEANARDFTGLLEAFIHADHDYLPAGPIPDAILVDEAQDLNALQWKVVERLLVLCSRERPHGQPPALILAGDDDQAIMAFQGADALALLQACEANPHAVKVLGNSYRLTPPVHALATRWSRRIRRRVQKVFMPGRNSRLEAPQEQPPDIARVFGSTPPRALQAAETTQPVNAWLCRTTAQVNTIVSAMHRARPDMLVLGRTGERSWSEGPPPRFDTPRLTVSTIHQAKGREWDHVMLDMRLPPNSKRTLDRVGSEEADAEHRVWYVGATRARWRLTLLLGPHSCYHV